MDLIHYRGLSTHLNMKECAFPVKMKPGWKARFTLVKLLYRRFADKPQVAIIIHFHSLYQAIGDFHQFIAHAIHYSTLHGIYFFPDELKIVIGTHIGAVFIRVYKSN
jgi:hypothetical protein